MKWRERGQAPAASTTVGWTKTLTTAREGKLEEESEPGDRLHQDRATWEWGRRCFIHPSHHWDFFIWRHNKRFPPYQLSQDSTRTIYFLPALIVREQFFIRHFGRSLGLAKGKTSPGMAESQTNWPVKPNKNCKSTEIANVREDCAIQSQPPLL